MMSLTFDSFFYDINKHQTLCQHTYVNKSFFRTKKKKDGTVMVGMYRQLSIGNERNKWVCISFDKDDLVLILWTVFFNNK